MLRTAVRTAGMGLAVCGLAVAVAPAAFASTGGSASRPVTQTLTHASAASITSPCDGSTVATSGEGAVTTVTDGQHTAVVLADGESGDGFVLALGGTGSFSSLSSSYSFSASGTWVDPANLADSFHGSFTVTLTVSAANAPLKAVTTSVNSLTCGL
jgi:hypothetical protein